MSIKIDPKTGDITETPDKPKPLEWHPPSRLPDDWIEENRANIMKRLLNDEILSDEQDDRSDFVIRMTDPDWY